MKKIAPDGILEPEEVERFTGIPCESHIRQANFLRKKGIHCIVNDQREVVVTWSWIKAAAQPPALVRRQRSNDRDLDEPDFRALDRRSA